MSNFNIESVELRVKNMAIMKEYYSEKLKFHIDWRYLYVK